ncbi:metal-dependent transcriptional regulator [Leucobacter celer]|uniref:metal-dependent transcriptional regulator n=1 Tax=Leucobacter celer TaxID=668625 RepID=UPI0006A769DB|nr:metal-dependent transcriptional regulator [Leucobacter celer]
MPTPRDATITPYLKTIWILQHEEQTRVGVTVLTERLVKAPATVSQTVRALADARLIRHEPYGPIELTLTGERLALAVVRHNRIARAFLYQVLGYPWPNVATEADTLMPVLNDDLANRLHAVSGSPHTDPYGNPIPGCGKTAARRTRPLCEQPINIELDIVRVADTDIALLGRLHAIGLIPGRVVRVARMDRATGVIDVISNNRAHTIGVHVARRILTASPNGREQQHPAQGSVSTDIPSSARDPDRPFAAS